MSQIEAIFLDCDGTPIDSEAICSRVYVTIFRESGIHVDLEGIFTCFKGVKLYGIIDIISKEQNVTMIRAGAEHIHRAEVTRLPDTELEDIAGVNELLASVNVSMCAVSNGPVSKMQYSFGKPNMLHYLPEKLFSGYDTQRWKPDPASMFHVAKAMSVNVENCILVDDSSAGMQSGIDAGMEVSYFCVDPHSKSIVHPEVTTFTHLSQLPELWKVRGWNIMA